jgi:colanic acid/amylovoran biosynthesis glycosyltransferase
MKEASVFVHHSVTAGNGDMEGIPNALIEAMAMQLPVVSTWHSGIPELVEHEVNGYLVEERDISALADCLYLALDRGLLPHNREKLHFDFNIAAHNAKLESFYQQIRVLNSIGIR